MGICGPGDDERGTSEGGRPDSAGWTVSDTDSWKSMNLQPESHRQSEPINPKRSMTRTL